MIPLLLRVLPFLLAAAPAAAAGWFAHGVKFDWFDRPAIIREATARADDACTIRTQAAATRAEQAERARQAAANAEARRIYDAALANSEQVAAAAATALDQEIADRETILASEGRSCGFTDDDLRWLYDNGPAPTGGSGGPPRGVSGAGND